MNDVEINIVSWLCAALFALSLSLSWLFSLKNYNEKYLKKHCMAFKVTKFEKIMTPIYRIKINVTPTISSPSNERKINEWRLEVERMLQKRRRVHFLIHDPDYLMCHYHVAEYIRIFLFAKMLDSFEESRGIPLPTLINKRFQWQIFGTAKKAVDVNSKPKTTLTINTKREANIGNAGQKRGSNSLWYTKNSQPRSALQILSLDSSSFENIFRKTFAINQKAQLVTCLTPEWKQDPPQVLPLLASFHKASIPRWLHVNLIQEFLCAVIHAHTIIRIIRLKCRRVPNNSSALAKDITKVFQQKSRTSNHILLIPAALFIHEY